MISFPNAKINIGLSVLGKREDGYHEIESFFYPIGCCDILEINKGDGFTFKQSGIETGKGINLCEKAYNLIKAKHSITGVDIFLYKAIPVGAGLGGGSSDAAFTIKMLNNLFSLDLKVEKMKEYAAELGSDCAFFIENKPAIASGRGEILKSIDIDLNKYIIYLAFPDVFVSTAEAYKEIVTSDKTIGLENKIFEPIVNWKHKISNDFETTILKKYPQIKNYKDTFYKMGAIYSSMSGSGSAVFGIFEKEQKGYKNFNKIN